MGEGISILDGKLQTFQNLLPYLRHGWVFGVQGNVGILEVKETVGFVVDKPVVPAQ